jgi:uncharacterized protein YsxB (DUF464 family)
MIKVAIFRNTDGEIYRYSVTGHANTAAYGQDIVCAGVSTLTQTAVLGLEQQLGRQFHLIVKSGKIDVELQNTPDELTAAILETMLIGLNEIAKINPDSVQVLEHRR